MTPELHVFIVSSRLQALVSLLVASQNSEHKSLVYYSRKEIGGFLSRFPFVESHCFDNRKYLFFKKERRIKEQLLTVRDKIKDCKADTVHFYMSSLYGTSNYFVNYMKRQMQETALTFNVITIGVNNFKKSEMTDRIRKKMEEKRRRFKNRLFGLKYYMYEGDRWGIEADVVNKIYMLPGMPKVYDPRRVVEVSVRAIERFIAKRASSLKKALVVGERLTDNGLLRAEDERVVSSNIAAILKESSVEQVDYVRHPASIHWDSYEPWYEKVTTEAPIELQILENDYRIIIGIASTALFTARMIAGKGCRIISVGLDRCLGRNDLAAEIRQTFQAVGIEVIDVAGPVA